MDRPPHKKQNEAARIETEHELGEFEDTYFPTPDEVRRLRRMLWDDEYRRRLKTAIGIWIKTFGIVTGAIVAAQAVWEHILMKVFLK